MKKDKIKSIKRMNKLLVIEKCNGNILTLEKHCQTKLHVIALLPANDSRIYTCNFGSLRAAFSSLKTICNYI